MNTDQPAAPDAAPIISDSSVNPRAETPAPECNNTPTAPVCPVLESVAYIERFQAWRVGADERTMEEAGLVPAEITRHLAAVLEAARSACQPTGPACYGAGKVIRAGTMNVSGEELTGVFVRIPRESLKALPNALYRDVMLCPLDIWERHNTQLAAISTASIQNTEASRAERIGRESPYWTVAYGDVCAAVDCEIKLRQQLAERDAELAALVKASQDRMADEISLKGAAVGAGDAQKQYRNYERQLSEKDEAIWKLEARNARLVAAGNALRAEAAITAGGQAACDAWDAALADNGGASSDQSWVKPAAMQAAKEGRG